MKVEPEFAFLYAGKPAMVKLYLGGQLRATLAKFPARLDAVTIVVAGPESSEVRVLEPEEVAWIEVEGPPHSGDWTYLGTATP